MTGDDVPTVFRADDGREWRSDYAAAARPDARQVEEALAWFRENPAAVDHMGEKSVHEHAAVLVRAALAAGPDEQDIQGQAREYTSNVFESGSYGSMGSEVEAAWAAGFRTALAGGRPAAADIDTLNALAGDVWHAIACGGNDDESMADIYRRLRELLPERLRGRPAEDALAQRPAAEPDEPSGLPDVPPDVTRRWLRERDEARQEAARLRSEVAALHTWTGLMSLLDEHWPADVVDGSSGDPGPRIVVLLREIAKLRDAGNALAGLVERWFNSFPEPLDPTIALDAWRAAAGALTEETDHG